VKIFRQNAKMMRSIKHEREHEGNSTPSFKHARMQMETQMEAFPSILRVGKGPSFRDDFTQDNSLLHVAIPWQLYAN